MISSLFLAPSNAIKTINLFITVAAELLLRNSHVNGPQHIIVFAFIYQLHGIFALGIRRSHKLSEIINF